MTARREQRGERAQQAEVWAVGPAESSGTTGGGPDGAANDARDVAPDDTRPDVPAAVDARTDGGADAGGGGPYPEAPGL